MSRFDILHRGTPHVKQGKVKVRFSYRLSRFLAKLMFFILGCFMFLGLMLAIFYFAKPMARVDNEIVWYERTVDLKEGDLVLTQAQIEFYDPVLYWVKQKNAGLMEVVGLPLSLQSIDGQLRELKSDEFFLACVQGCPEGKVGIVKKENVLGRIKE